MQEGGDINILIFFGLKIFLEADWINPTLHWISFETFGISLPELTSFAKFLQAEVQFFYFDNFFH